MKKRFLLLIVLIFLNIFFSCSKPEEILSAEAKIIKITIEANNIEYLTTISSDGIISLKIELPFEIQDIKIKTLEISEGATANISVGRSYSVFQLNIPIKVTAENKSDKRDYTLKLLRETPSNQAKILKFILDVKGEEFTATSDTTTPTELTINSKLPYGTEEVTIKEIIISEKATTEVKAGDIFKLANNPNEILVIAQDGTSFNRFKLNLYVKDFSIEKITPCYVDLKWDDGGDNATYKIFMKNEDDNTTKEIELASQILEYRFDLKDYTNYKVWIEVTDDGNTFQSLSKVFKTESMTYPKRLFSLSDKSIKTIFLDNGDFITIGAIRDGAFSNDFGYIARFTNDGDKVWEYKAQSRDEFWYFSSGIVDGNYIYATGHGFKNVGTIKLDLNGNLINKYLQVTTNNFRSKDFIKVNNKFVALIYDYSNGYNDINYYLYWFDENNNFLDKNSVIENVKIGQTNFNKIIKLNNDEIALVGVVFQGNKSLGVNFSKYNFRNKNIVYEKIFYKNDNAQHTFLKESNDGNLFLGLSLAASIQDNSTYKQKVIKINHNGDVISDFQINELIPAPAPSSSLLNSNSFRNITERPNGEIWLLGYSYTEDFSSIGINLTDNKNVGAIFKLSSDFILKDIVTFYGGNNGNGSYTYFNTTYIRDNNDNTFTVISPYTSVQVGRILEDGTSIECE